MTWEETLIVLLDSSRPITTALTDGSVTADNVWTHPAFGQSRDKLVELLTKEGTVDSMLEASRKLREKHQQLLLKDKISTEELRALGVLSAAAYALSGEALARSVTPQAIFMYTILRIMPWIERLAGVAGMINRGGRGLDEVGPDAARLRELLGELRALVERMGVAIG